MSGNRRPKSSAARWQSLSSSSKRHPATSVSLVFAQPEQGTPLRSAIDNLPALGINDSASFMSDMSRKRERSESTATSPTRDADEDIAKRPKGLSPPDAPSIDLPAEAAREEMRHDTRNETTETTSPHAEPTHTTSVPFPILPPEALTSTLRPSPSRLSWFGSLSRGTAKPDIVSIMSAEQGIVVHTQPGYAPTLGVKQPETTSQEPVAVPTTSISEQQPVTPEITVEEDNPRLRVTSTPEVPSPPLVQRKVEDSERRSSVSSPSPSASRFALRIPFFGYSQPADVRPAEEPDSARVPATTEGAPNEAAVDGDVTPSEYTGRNQPMQASPESDHESTPVISSIPDPVANAPGEQSANEEQKGGQLPAPQTEASPSWWSYLGWASEQQPSSESMKHPDITLNDGALPEGSSSQAIQSPSDGATASVPSPQAGPNNGAPNSPSNGEATSGMTITPERDTANNVEHQLPEHKPASIISEDTTRSQGSAWYSPWAWYSPQLAAGSSENSTGAPGAENSQKPDDSPKTESEIVKEAALAREAAEQTAAAEVTPRVEAPNPIESAVASNPSNWLSFFTSSRFTKTITDHETERDENGMEVMNIDEDEDVATGEVTLVADGGAKRGRHSPSPSLAKSPSSPRASEGTPAPPLTNNETLKRKTTVARSVSRSSTTRSTARSTASAPAAARPSPPNLVLPTWEDTFHVPPRSYVPKPARASRSKLSKTLSLVGGALWSRPEGAEGKGKGKERERQAEFLQFGQELPKALDVIDEPLSSYILNGGCRVAVIGVYGWSPGAVTRAFAPGTPYSSVKFVDMTCQALERFAEEHQFKFKKITRIPLDGDGVVAQKVAQVYDHLLGNDEWMEDLHAADVIFVATHSQGSIVSTHLVNQLILDGHILTKRSVDTLVKTASSLGSGNPSAIASTQAQRICFLAMCGVHLGPLRYLRTSSLLSPYIQYVENAAARELFEFQNTETQTSKDYVEALRNVMDHGAKMVYIASLNDQVVPIYSGLFMAASHPRILRALYIDGDAYHSSDFLSNLLILLIRIINAGLSDSGLLAHLSEATAGSLTGIGHSTVFEEPATFSFAIKYCFLTNDGTQDDAKLVVEPFNAVNEQNDYEIPWSLRDLIANEKVSHFFSSEFAQLRDAFDDWHPKTSILRDVKRKLQPIQRLSSLSNGSVSKL